MSRDASNSRSPKIPVPGDYPSGLCFGLAAQCAANILYLSLNSMSYPSIITQPGMHPHAYTASIDVAALLTA